MPNNKSIIIKIKEAGVFERKILNSHGLHIVRFCAAWSGPCQIMGPIYEEMHTLFKTTASFYRIDIDEAPLLKEQLGITELPTILIYKNGIAIDFITGLISREMLIATLKNTIK